MVPWSFSTCFIISAHDENVEKQKVHGVVAAPEGGPGDVADGGWGVGLEGLSLEGCGLGLEGLVGEGLMVEGLDGLDLKWVVAAGLGLITVVSFSLELTLSARCFSFLC